MKTHLHVGYSAVGLLLSPVLQSAGHRQEVLLQLLGRDGLWASFISGGLYRYISYPSSGRAIGAPGAWTRQEVHTKVVQVVHFVFQKNTKLPI